MLGRGNTRTLEQILQVLDPVLPFFEIGNAPAREVVRKGIRARHHQVLFMLVCGGDAASNLARVVVRLIVLFYQLVVVREVL